MRNYIRRCYGFVLCSTKDFQIVFRSTIWTNCRAWKKPNERTLFAQNKQFLLFSVVCPREKCRLYPNVNASFHHFLHCFRRSQSSLLIVLSLVPITILTSHSVTYLLISGEYFLWTPFNIKHKLYAVQIFASFIVKLCYSPKWT